MVDRFRPRTVHDLDDPERRMKLEAAVEASGWRELRAPTELGAPLATGVEVGIVAEELGRGLIDVPFIGPTLAVDLRRCAGGPSARSLETVVLTSDLSSILPAGTEPWSGVAVDAGGCTSAVVLGSGRTLTEVRVGPRHGSVDLTRPSAAVLRGEAGTATAGPGPVDEPELVRWTALGLSAACSDMVGAMRGALDLACDYARARRQFGVAVGSFQSVQHLLADALVSLEGSRSVALHAGWAVDVLPPDEAITAAALAKAYCGRAARAVCEVAIQVHGGIGNTWDCLAHLYLRRALLSTDLLGGVGPSLDRVATSFGGSHGLH
jgi:alkylation response protein AidB-like acyl-CoA dehydrogenase